jgi:hypothetical protein
MSHYLKVRVTRNVNGWLREGRIVWLEEVLANSLVAQGAAVLLLA